MVCGNLHTDGPHQGVTAALQRDTLLHKFTKYTLHAIPCSPVCTLYASIPCPCPCTFYQEELHNRFNNRYLEALLKVVYAGSHKCSKGLLLW